MDNFFSCGKTSNYSRDYSKGKSFKFSEWNETDYYNNDEFIQDWVTCDGVLWVCLKNNTNERPYEGSDYWTLAISGEDIHTIRWNNFEE